MSPGLTANLEAVKRKPLPSSFLLAEYSSPQVRTEVPVPGGVPWLLGCFGNLELPGWPAEWVT